MTSRPEDTLNLKDIPQDADPTALTPPLPPAPPSPTAYLVRIHPKGPTLGLRYPVGGKPVLVGRSVACAVCDPDPSVSRAHARVESGPGGWFRVTDLGSTNGTFVNHARVGAAELHDGDYLGIGKVIYRFLAGENLEAGYHEELYRLAVTDPLTELPNRRALMEHLGRE